MTSKIVWQGVIYLDKPTFCAKCGRMLSIMAVPIDGKLYGFYCATGLGWQPSQARQVKT